MTDPDKNPAAGLQRCDWAGEDPIYQKYHDEEWGVPEWDRIRLFEMLLLEGAQAGLSWITVLKKRQRYREVFHGFEPERVAAMTLEEQQTALKDPGIIRNRLKVAAFVNNAQALLKLEADISTSFADWLWETVGGVPRVNNFATMAEVPASTPESDQLSRRLKRAGFKFVGTTICYAFMQATGMVNDHLTSCFRHPQNLDREEFS